MTSGDSSKGTITTAPRECKGNQGAPVPWDASWTHEETHAAGMRLLQFNIGHSTLRLSEGQTSVDLHVLCAEWLLRAVRARPAFRGGGKPCLSCGLARFKRADRSECESGDIVVTAKPVVAQNWTSTTQATRLCAKRRALWSDGRGRGLVRRSRPRSPNKADLQSGGPHSLPIRARPKAAPVHTKTPCSWSEGQS
jgi:hypothetical protein